MTYTTEGTNFAWRYLLFMDYMFTFFEWHTQRNNYRWYWQFNCLWTICLLFLNDIHNPGIRRRCYYIIVYGLYVYFFWMTYTTIRACARIVYILFMDYMFTFFEWHTQRGLLYSFWRFHCLWTICLLFLNDIHNYSSLPSSFTSLVFGLYVYFFWMTYTTETDWEVLNSILFLDYMFTFFEWHTQLALHIFGHALPCFWTICLLFLNDIHNDRGSQ